MCTEVNALLQDLKKSSVSVLEYERMAKDHLQDCQRA